MSYSRKGKDSDIYLIGTEDGFECLGCPLMEMETYTTADFVKGLSRDRGEEIPYTFQMRGSAYMKTAKEALQHLQTHNYHGHRFNAYALERLRGDVRRENE